MLLIGHCLYISHVQYFRIYLMFKYFIAPLVCSIKRYFNFTLSYTLSTFQVVTHTCASSFHNVGSSLNIQNMLRLVLNLQFSRISGDASFSKDNDHEFLSSILALQFLFFFQIILGYVPTFQVSLKAYLRLRLIQLSIELISLLC